jgi:uncharacterized protein YfiM (DUF2279 family)
MHGLLLLFTLHVGDGPASADRWFARDKAKHFFSAAFVQTISFSALRAAGASRKVSLAGATVTTSAVSIGKEVCDLEYGGDPSLRDLTWDAAGMLAATALLVHTKR